jgi:hypothetical protein
MKNQWNFDLGPGFCPSILSARLVGSPHPQPNTNIWFRETPGTSEDQ